MIDPRREALARQICERMKRDADERIELPSGENLPLWKIAARAADAIPASLRTMMDKQGQNKPKSLRQRLAMLFRRYRRADGWINPRDALPERQGEGVLSNLVLVKVMDKVKPAVLLYGTPIGSHRWILNKDRPDEYYAHVLDIDGWQEMK